MHCELEGGAWRKGGRAGVCRTAINQLHIFDLAALAWRPLLSPTITPPLPPHATTTTTTYIHNMQAADKTTSSVNKTAKDVKKTVNKALKKEDEHKHLKEAAVAVPVVALVIAGTCVNVIDLGGEVWERYQGGRGDGAFELWRAGVP